jgi:DNA-binding beta-propeller fold protein YncE
MTAKKTLAVIPVARTVQRIALSADDRTVFTSDQVEPRLAVIDTATNKVRQWVKLPAAGYGTAATRDGRWLLLAVPGANQVAVVDLSSMEVARAIDVPSAPQEVLIRPDNRVAYVSCDASHQVAEIALSDWKVSRLIEAGKGADGLAWAPSR